MNAEEKDELRGLLVNEIGRWSDPMVDGNEWLNEDRGARETTDAELSVFQIDPDYLERLSVAYWAYEVLIDKLSPAPFSDRVNDLIVKARSICPPITSYGKAVEFTTDYDDYRFFYWFAKTFLDVPIRQSYGFYYKRHFNQIHTYTFGDEG